MVETVDSEMRLSSNSDSNHRVVSQWSVTCLSGTYFSSLPHKIVSFSDGDCCDREIVNR